MVDNNNLTEDAKRLLKVINFLGISERQFALEIGFKTGDTVYNIKHGKHNLTRKTAKKITTRYPNISYDFLLTGQGDVTTTGEIPKEDLDIQVRIYKLESQCQRYEEIIDSLNKSIALLENKKGNQLDTQTIVRKLEEKCEEILTCTINENFGKVDDWMEKIERKF